MVFCCDTFLVNGASEAITEDPLMEMYQNHKNYDENRRKRIQKRYRSAYRKSKVIFKHRLIESIRMFSVVKFDEKSGALIVNYSGLRTG